MTITVDFEYFKPGTLDEAVHLLGELGPKARVLAGGTDIVGWMRDDLIQPEALVDLKGIPGLTSIDRDNGHLKLGALVTFCQLVESPVLERHAPIFGEMARVVASAGVRNRATMVGNLCSSVPCCDAGPVLLIYEAKVRTLGPNGSREIPIGDWFVAPRKTSLAPGEIVTSIVVPVPKPKHAGCYVKLRRYEGEDLAQASVAVLAADDGTFRVAFGAVAPTPVRGQAIEAVLKGKKLDKTKIRKAIDLLPKVTAPITDVRASKEYRAHMLGVMLERGLEAALARLSGGGPAYGTEVI